MAKKSDAGCATIVIVAIGAVAAVPKEAWFGIGFIAVIGVVLYFLLKGSNQAAQKLPQIDSSSTGFVQQPSRFTSPRPSQDGFSLSVTADSCWKPPGTATEVAGNVIADGGIYVGLGLASVAGNDVEPALINPKLSLDVPADFFETLGYWPSYSRISSRARGKYIQWLVEGRKDPATDIGYIFLFFYGLERRMLADNPADGHVERELPWVRHEVARLLSLYGPLSGSFRGYASGFLEFLGLSDITDERFAYDSPAPVPGAVRRLGLTLKLGLGRAAAEGKPIRPDWAYAWLMSDERVRLRTAAQRCSVEFKDLYLARYREVYGQGMKISPPKTKLKAVYKPASSSFGHRILEAKFDDIPDISVSEAPLQRLYELADQVTDQLGPYSRLIARDSAKAGSLAGLLLLPPVLWPDEHVTRLGQWLTEIGADTTAQAVRFGELIRHFPAWEDMNKEKVWAFSTALESFGVGMEPDVRWGGPVPEEEEPVVLFPLEKNERLFVPTALYKAAALTMHMAAVVTVADGGSSLEEEGHLESQIERWPNLTVLERKRLRAFLKWLLLAKPSLTGLKRLTKELDDLQKRGLATFLIHVAQAESGVSPKELKALGKIYRLLGLSEEELYSQAHAAVTEPVTVQSATPVDKRYVIPGRPAAPSAAANALDEKRIEALKKESEEVSKLLAGIFAESGQEQSAAVTDPEPEPAAEAVVAQPKGPFRNLDAEHSSFAQLLTSRSQWTRAELQDLAEDRNIMLDGALEKINEAVLEQFNEPLFEGDDPVEINTNVLKELVTA